MSARLLILTAGFGEGHNAAAHALRDAADEMHGADAARVADVFALAAPRLNPLLRRAYIGLINEAPNVWSAAYRWIDRSAVFPFVLRSMRRERRMIVELIRREEPAAIVCTFPAYAYLLGALARAGRLPVPFFNVVTDSISINSLWWRGGATGWFLPNEDSADVLRRARIDEQKLHVLGFPVPRFFQAHAEDLSPPLLGYGVTPRVLYIVNSGTRAAAETARRLLLETPWEITCTVGRNEALRDELQRLGAGRAMACRVLGWTDEIPRLLMTHHVVVSKAGGATTQEALAARCPMIVNQIVPGQEEGNYALLRRHGIGALAQSPTEVIAALRLAFRAQGLIWRQWRGAINALARPRAAYDIVATIDAEGSGHEQAESIPMPFRRASAARA